MYLRDNERAELITDLEDLLAQRTDHASVKVYSVGPQDRDTTLGEASTEKPDNVV
jgi:hypothetical protein